MNDLKDVTFTIPIRVDMRERGICLHVVVGCLLHYFDTNIIILEDDKEQKVPKYLPKDLLDRCNYIFVKTDNELFHRTRWLNEMAKAATTPIVVNQDGDLACKPEFLLRSANVIRNGECKFSIPYERNVHFYHGGTEKRFINSGFDFEMLKKERRANTGQGQVGGIVFSDQQTYFEIGMENENFVSWGFEDDERMHRMVALGYPPKRITGGELYHFHHGRNINSDYSNPNLKKNIAERNKILGMKMDELKTYVQTWPWIQQG